MSDDGQGGFRQRPTLADVARSLSVSPATVSRALRDDPQIGERTRRRVQAAAAAMGYVANAAARHLARKTSRSLGLLVPDVTDPLHGLIVAGFGRIADGAGYTMIVIDGSRDDQRRERGVQMLIEHRVQGLAFCGAPVSPVAARARVRPAHAVFIIPEGHDAGEGETGPLGRIRADDEHGIGMLVDHLLATGCRRLSYVNGPDLRTNRTRRRAVIAALERAGVEPRIREYEASLEPDDLARVAALVTRERPDALICYDDKQALHLMDALRRRGLAIPGDIAVTGFDGIPFALISHPRLTTVVQPAERLGEAAAEALLGSIETGEPPADQTLDVVLALGGSTGAGEHHADDRGQMFSGP